MGGGVVRVGVSGAPVRGRCVVVERPGMSDRMWEMVEVPRRIVDITGVSARFAWTRGVGSARQRVSS